MRVGVFRGELGLVTPSSPYFSHFCNNSSTYSSIWRLHKHPSSLAFGHNYITHKNQNQNQNSFVASASSAPSLGGSGAEYSGQLLDARTKKKKKAIAGIDQHELVDPKNLADIDSCFCEFNGVHIHHKIYEPESQAQSSFQNQTASDQIKKLGFPLILLHGFGASVFSWMQVMKPLAELTGSKVLAFDRPAFGLTSRVDVSKLPSSDAKPLNAYSMAFSVLATLHFIDLLNAEKAILVGHSAGSLVAVNTYFEAPERVAALILIAPAIFAPLNAPKINQKGQSRQDNQVKEDNSSVGKNPILALYNLLSKITKFIAGAITQMMKRMMDMLNSLYRKLLAAILRSSLAITLVRMAIDRFGTAAVRNAWYNPNQVSEHVLSGYTRPLRTKDWDRALVEYTAAMLLDEESKTKPSLSERLHEISCPVLIVTGDSDRLVPSWNAERLSRIIPGASFELIKQCGHLPHEEKVEEFLSIVENFLKRLVGDSSRQYVQSAV